MNSDPYVMYLVVRTSLKMNVGKTAAQVGHAVQMWMEWCIDAYVRRSNSFKGENLELETFARWLKDDHPSYMKIVLGASDEEFERCKRECKVQIVIDRGFTEVPAGTETVLAVFPCKKSEAPEAVRRLKLLR